MPDPTRPSREAREAAEELLRTMLGPATGSIGRAARALDAFAEKVQQERDALRERVADMEKADAEFVALIDRQEGIATKARDDRDHWKARAERAEGALDEIVDMDPYEIHEGIAWPQRVAQEARRARGDS